jgi:hypothetical protein
MSFANISPVDKSYHNLSLIVLTQGQKSTLQAQVLAVVTLNLNNCHVV